MLHSMHSNVLSAPDDAVNDFFQNNSVWQLRSNYFWPIHDGKQSLLYVASPGIAAAILVAVFLDV